MIKRYTIRDLPASDSRIQKNEKGLLNERKLNSGETRLSKNVKECEVLTVICIKRVKSRDRKGANYEEFV